MGESRIKTKLGQDISQRLNKPKSFSTHTHTQTYTKSYIHIEIKTLFLKELRVNYFTLETFDKIYADLVLFATTVASQNVLAWLQRIDWREERGICFS